MTKLIMRSKNIVLGIVASLLLFASCSVKEVEVQDGRYNQVCELKYNLCPLADLSSFDWLDKEHFVVSDEKSVVLYNTAGDQLRKIGNSGNAKYEYNSPTVVKCHGDSIYVWSSRSLKFISFHRDGAPGAEYSYMSAVRDFDVSEDKIYVYTAGRRDTNLIDVLKKSDLSLTAISHPTSEEHQLMLSSFAAAPLAIDGDKLLCSAKDGLSIYSYSTSDNALNKEIAVSSETFAPLTIKESGTDPDSRQSFSKYLRENPMTLKLYVDGSNYKLLTLEGVAGFEDKKINNEPRYFSLYTVASGSGKLKQAHHYTYATFAQRYSFSDLDGDLYYMFHEVKGEEDVYSLRCLIQ